jgi:AcrR family transcriptional regulator
MSERRERERHEMRERIVDAARRLFTTEGYDKVTLRRIAEEIEYTPGTIYQYFKDKDAILYAVHEHGFVELGGQLAKVVAGAVNPRDALERIGREYIRFARENPEMYDLMFIAQATTRAMDSEEWPEGKRTYDLLRGMVKTALDGGWIAGGDVDSLSFLFWSTAHGMASLRIRDRCTVIPEADRDRVQDDALGVLMERIATTKTSPASDAEPAKPRAPRRGAPEA